jgi:hypothetical protein
MNPVVPSLHDGHLVGISVADRNVLVMSCRPLGRPVMHLRVTGLVDLCANNFRSGNIILSVDVHDSVERLGDEAIRALAQSDRPEHLIAYRSRMRARDASNEVKYLVLESSYGCDLVAVFTGALTVDAVDATAPAE